LYFEIEQTSNKLGLLERNKKGDRVLIDDKSELQNDKLYYLYFRDKPLERCLSPTIHGEETKKVRFIF
jgi:hypothetical protein